MSKRRSPIKKVLLEKSQESALSAIQTFNNPLIQFKSEIFIVLMVIAWTYLLHAYYRSKKIDMRYPDNNTNNRRKYIKIGDEYKLWELSSCLKSEDCPLDQGIIDNLNFLIGIRNKIEHTGSHELHHYISAKFQACCINYNQTLKRLFGDSFSLDKKIPISLQLFSFGESQIDSLKDKKGLPQNIIEFINSFEGTIEDSNDSQYSYKVLYTRDSVSNVNKADMAYRFLAEDSEDGKKIHNVLFKQRNYTKITETGIVELMQEEGFSKFKSSSHRIFWKSKWPTLNDRNKKAKEFGELLPTGNQWLWYEEKWVPEVRAYCVKNSSLYK
tara:strand:+ start:2367 stop:3347 length:981 start_codon:yes stop_codon:yes gene_type:complete